MHKHGQTEGRSFNAIVVGAGFAGLYMLYRLRQLGFSARVVEAYNGVGGTWYCNRYPGARCDVESLQYSYSFSDELQQEWTWTERYATQPEILRYLSHVADRFDLRRDIQLGTRVISATFNEEVGTWQICTDRGETFTARFCIMATGCLSVPKQPDIAGLDQFQGSIYRTSTWPHENVEFSGQRVGILGTGSSGLQCIPVIASQAAHLTIFQRTPCFSVPAHNGPVDEEEQRHWKANYTARREEARGLRNCILGARGNKSALEVTPEEREQEFEHRWRDGGLPFMLAYTDLIFHPEANAAAAAFIHSKIRSKVHDPAVAARLLPHDHPVGTRRLCVDTGYYETYNRPNVTLVDLRADPIIEMTQAGVRTAKLEYPLDSLVLATGFDAMTGALLRVEIVGRAGLALQQSWSGGPRTYLGLMAAGFPNMFMVTGPGSPSVLTNMAVSIEHHVDWIIDCLAATRQRGMAVIEATEGAQEHWGAHVNDLANGTLYTQARSWYMGANVPGKPRAFLPYIGGFDVYRRICDEVSTNDYQGFQLSAS